MAAGKSVIAPRIGGCGEVVDDNHTGYLFESANVTDLSNCMKKILSNDRYKEFGIAARQRVEDYFSRRQWVEGDEKIYLSYTATE